MASPPPFFPIATDALERDDISEVLPNRLFITNWRGGSDSGALQNLKVTHIAAIGEEFLENEEDIEGITYYKHGERPPAHHTLHRLQVHPTQWTMSVLDTHLKPSLSPDPADIGDNEDEASKMGSSLRDAAGFIDGGVRGGGVVLVHCAAGASRSATAVLAYQVRARSRIRARARGRGQGPDPGAEGPGPGLFRVRDNVRAVRRDFVPAQVLHGGMTLRAAFGTSPPPSPHPLRTLSAPSPHPLRTLCRLLRAARGARRVTAADRARAW